MSKLICDNCGSEFEVTGKTYPRKKGGKVDYLCAKRLGGCGSERKPVTMQEKKEEIWGSESGLVGLDKAYAECNSFWSPNVYSRGCGLNQAASLKQESRVLVIPDIHTPFMRDGAIEFLESIYEKYDCNTVVCLGDEIDFNFSSFHGIDPDGMSAERELKKAIKQLASLAESFPEIKVCSGNHSDIPKRKAYAAGLSEGLIKDLKSVYIEHGASVENWEFADHFVIDNVKYCHGTGRKAKARMVQDGVSIVQGHYHSESYVTWHVNQYQKLFAMQLGALVNDEAYAFAYGKHFAKSHKNCGVVINGVPTIEYMEL